MTHLGGYELDRVVGHGATAVVWRARRTGPVPGLVAIKRLRLGADDTAAARLAHEARILAIVDHPHVVRLLDVIEDADGLSLVLPYAEDGSLAARLQGASRWDPDATVALLALLADALGSLHRRGIVHGDVAPANVLLTSDGLPVLCDLGTASPAPDLPTRITGTVGYVDPAVVGGAAPAPTADVHGLAAVGYRLLAGRPPSDGDPGPHAPVPLAVAAPGVPPAVAAVLDRALSVEPSARQADGSALARELREAVGHAAAVAVPVVGATAAPATFTHTREFRRRSAG